MKYFYRIIFLSTLLSVTSVKALAADYYLDKRIGFGIGDAIVCPGDTIKVPVYIASGASWLYGLSTATIRIQNPDTNYLEPILVSKDTGNTGGVPLITGISEKCPGLIYRYNIYKDGRYPEMAAIFLANNISTPRTNTMPTGTVLFYIHYKLKRSLSKPIAMGFNPIFQEMLWTTERTGNDIFARYHVDYTDTGWISPRSVPTAEIKRDTSAALKHRLSDPARLPLQSICGMTTCVNNEEILELNHAPEDGVVYYWSFIGAPDDRYTGYKYIKSGSITVDQMAKELNRDHFGNSNGINGLTAKFIAKGGYMFNGLMTGVSLTAINQDGCMNYDTMAIGMYPTNNTGLKRDTTVDTIVREGTVLEFKDVLNFPLTSKVLMDSTMKNPAVWSFLSPITLTWSPAYLFSDNNLVRPTTYPLTESVEITVTMTDGWGCSAKKSFYIEVHGDSLFGRIQRPDYTCNDSVKGQMISVTSLINGGFGNKTYQWSAKNLYSGKQPVVYSPDATKTDILVYGKTAISLFVYDDSLQKSIIIYDTITAFDKTPATISIDYTQRTKDYWKQNDSVYCIGDSIIIEAKCNGVGLNGYINWYTNGNINPLQRGKTFVYKSGSVPIYAELMSDAICSTVKTAKSNTITPNIRYYSSLFMHNMYDSTQNGSCSSDSANLGLWVDQIGTRPSIISVFRNDAFVEEFYYYGKVLNFAHKVENKNYFDKYRSVANFNNACMREDDKNVPSRSTVMPYLQVSGKPVGVFIESDLGGDTLCNTTDFNFALRLKNLNNIGQNTSVVWMVNDKEWGRYNFSANGYFQEPTPVKINGNLKLDSVMQYTEQMAFDSGYPFVINKAFFPSMDNEIPSVDSVWAIIISNSTCNGENVTYIDSLPAIYPKILDMLGNAEYNIMSNPKYQREINSVCPGEALAFSVIGLKNVVRPHVDWFVNDTKVGEGFNLEINNLKQSDKVNAVLTSKYRCSKNLPLSSNVINVKVYPAPVANLPKDYVVCPNDSFIAPYTDVNIDYMYWYTADTTDFIGYKDTVTPYFIGNVKRPTIFPKHDSTKYWTRSYTLPGVNCMRADTMLVIFAPPINTGVDVTINSDTVICDGQLVKFSAVPHNAPQFEVTWFKNGYELPGHSLNISLFDIKTGDEIYCKMRADVFSCMFKDTVKSKVFKFKVNSKYKTEAFTDKSLLCGADTAFIFAIGGTHFKWTSTSDIYFNSEYSALDVAPTKTSVFYVKSYDADYACSAYDTVVVSVDQYYDVRSELQILNHLNPSFCERDDSTFVFKVNPVYGGESPNYVWYLNGEEIVHIFDTLIRTMTEGNTVQVEMFASEDIESCATTNALSEELVIVRLTKPIGYSEGDDTLCPQESTEISATGGDRYEWSPAQGLSSSTVANPTATPNLTTNYVVKIIANNDCYITDTVKLYVHPDPGTLQSYIAPVKDFVCRGDSAIYAVASNHPGYIRWYLNNEYISSADTISYSPNDNDTLYFELTSEVYCLPEKNITAQPFYPTILDVYIDLPERYNLCIYENYQIPLQTNATKFFWRPNMAIDDIRIQNPTVNPVQSFDYYLTATLGNCIKESSILVAVARRPDSPTVEDKLLCEDSIVNIDVKDIKPNISYKWFTDTNLTNVYVGTVYPNATVGEYFVKSVDTNDCASFQYATSAVTQGVPSVADYIIETDRLEARTPLNIVNNSDEWTEALWDFGDGYKEINNSNSFDYSYKIVGIHVLTLKVSNETGCIDSTSKYIMVLPQLQTIYVPNAFMPNAPQEEDKSFRVYGDIFDISMNIYSLSGVMLFSSNDANLGWDGKHNGKEMPAGNYSYYVSVTLNNGEKVTKSGNVTLIR
ncbi:hypothetical protein FACS1894153_2790 [Bacteroidia bacterium]|nr:hypothetical protein FACS1894153_2790 [Bacteroidia bacterium]